ncbi:malectin-B [Anthonomus grandis grandis]|uniref:malectin-B n=1 Tax=Anthonomus grandis grandis TaxID=2921223 RepID=UPI002165CC23|nr:malectin-B [Anthonomus grandis grandis]
MTLSQKTSLVLKFAALTTVLLFNLPKVYSVGQVIYAVNAGGDAHVDIHGVHYEKDPLNVGIASDYGKRLLIGRVPPKDHILYQTERYHTNTFGYDLPVPSDGQYVLVLKFCEVYFDSSDQKVFDVVLNGEHTIVPDLDIFSRVDKGVAHDEYVPFEIIQGKLYVNGEESDIAGNKVRLEFIKGYKDNPKINAFYLMKGTLDEVPKLPPLISNEAKEKESEQHNMEDDEEEEEKQSGRPRIIPTIPESEEPEESSIMLPVFIVIGAFIPILFFLCKL